MSHLRPRVVLVHELRQLARTKELFHRSRDRLGIDQVLRHQTLTLSHRESLFHRSLDANQTHTELVLGHLTNRADTAVTQVINVVNHALAVSYIDQRLEHRNNVFFVECATSGDLVTTQTTVKLHTSDP